MRKFIHKATPQNKQTSHNSSMHPKFLSDINSFKVSEIKQNRKVNYEA